MADRRARCVLSTLILFFASTTPLAVAAPSEPAWSTIDWPSFLSRSDMVWEALPDRWDRGAFTGNGLMGAMNYVHDGELAWELGRADIVDRQPAREPMTAAPRLPLGFLVWRGCEPASGQMRLDLWNAQTNGSINTTAGQATAFQSWTHALRNVIGIAVTGKGCVGRFEIEPAVAVSDRARARHEQPQANAPVQLMAEGTRSYAMQSLVGGAHVIAIDSFADKEAHITFVTTAKGRSAKEARLQADHALDEAKRRGWDQLTREHQEFWHSYYPQSFVSLPDSQLESFYWLQVYKLASATRSDGPIVDTLGPWYHNTPWPGLWWNLNVQLTYWPLYTANRLSQAESLLNGLRRGQAQLRANAQPRPGMAIGRTSAQDLQSPLDLIDLEKATTPEAPREYSNLLWALHNVWMHYTHSMDEALHRQVVSMLEQAVAFSTSLLTLKEDGRLHLPLAVSPEYPHPSVDTNYDLSLFTWALQTLLLPQNQSLVSARKRTTWARTLSQLPPFAADETGLMIGRDTPLAQSHRHFSHLMMVYPLGLLSPDVAADRDLIERSLAHWIGKEGALEGYSFVAASAISSRLGRGDDAASFLSQLIRRFVRRNTMYMEAGPVIETPLAAAQAIHEMLLHTRDEAVYVFPALPRAWKHVTFRDLRAPGAFLVSAERHDGQTTMVRVRSLKGGRLQLVLPADGHLQPVGPGHGRWRSLGPRKFELRLRRDETLSFASAGASAGGAPVAQEHSILNPFGSRQQNAWFEAEVASATAPKGKPVVTTITPAGIIPTWELLNLSVPTVFTDDGAEEVFWRHTSCDPCASEPVVATSAGKSTWVPLATSDGCFDFKKAFPTSSPKDTIAYLRTTIDSVTAADVTLQVGLNDQGRVWAWADAERPAPGNSVLVNTQGSTLGKNEARVQLKLHKGLNHLFIKTINQGGGWGTCIKRVGLSPAPSH